ncbi:MAG: hypothetical protein H6674_10790 [Dehalococcoidia bacterium]|nr:hypothetical protein [Dehalococcoidia bacterium]
MAVVDVTPSLIGVAREYPEAGRPLECADRCASARSATHRDARIKPFEAEKTAHSPWTSESDASLEGWKEISADVYTARLFRNACLVNAHLESASRERVLQPFASTFSAWIVNNYLYDGRPQDAIDSGVAWLAHWNRGEEATLSGLVQSWMAEAFVLQGRPEAAVEMLERAAAMCLPDTVDPAGDWLRIGGICESMGDANRAAWAYERGISTRGRRHTHQDLTRGLRRLHDATRFVACDPDDIASAVYRALTKGDHQALWTLASSTHFSLGQVGGEFGFTEPEVILPQLIQDLCASMVRGNPLDLIGTGRKRYLLTEGWAGRTFFGTVMLDLRRSEQGWEWCGVSTTVTTPGTRALQEAVFGPPSTYENQPLEILIKAPWAAGVSMQAGGGYQYWGTLAARIGSLLGFLADVDLAQRPCGFGPGGFYYGEGSHEDNRFAIDFSRFNPESVLDWGRSNISLNDPILAVADGHIQEVEARGRTGEAAMDNFVVQRIWKSAARTPITDPPGGPILNIPGLRRSANLMTPYHASYHHLTGPGRVPVLPGMFVEQGFVVGFCDSTGRAGIDHLHFEVRDTRLNELRVGSPPFDFLDPFYTADGNYGGTVRPSPMDGTDLLDGMGGRCVPSSNQIRIMRTPRLGGLPLLTSPFRDRRTMCEYLLYRLTGRTIDPSDAVDPRVVEALRSLCDLIPIETGGPSPDDHLTGPSAIPCPNWCRIDGCTDVRSDPRNCGACGRNCGVDDEGRPNPCRMGTCI